MVLVHLSDAEEASEHERCSLLGFAARLASLRGDEAGGFHDPLLRHDHRHAYFVPGSTLTSVQASDLGIAGVEDLFGGVVPHAFVATKAISHPLVRPGAAAVTGWSADFASRVQDVVLAGYTAFDPDDARAAGTRLMARGPVRVKPVRARGGLGQTVARDAATLQALLAAADLEEIRSHGLVLEEDLQELQTVSVGQVHVADLDASYFGFQRRTRNNEGTEVFGGSDLTVARGDFDALLALGPAPEIRHAIEQAGRYDAAVHACFPGFFSSRRNYDVLVGRDAAGNLRSAVLEQSWRAGGATGPEIAALEAFRAEPDRRWARASCFELFGDSPEPPPQATVYFRGDDPRCGRLTKYTVLEPR